MGYEQINAMLESKRGNYVRTDDTDEVLIIKYIGATVAGAVTVEVSATTGDLTFIVNGAADTTVVAVTGVIDVSETAYNTLAKVAATINGSPNWRCYIKDGLGSEVSAAAMKTMAATSAKTAEIVCYGDTSTKLSLDLGLTLEANTDGYELDELLGMLSKVYGITGYSTYASGTSKFQIYAVDCEDGTETKIYESATGATTVSASVTSTPGWKPGTRECAYKLVVRIINSAAMASASLTVDAALGRVSEA